MDKKYRYLGYFLLLLIPLIFAGFYKTYFQSFPNFEEDIDAYIHIHAAIATLWVVILIIQPFLIVNKKTVLHKKVGRLTYFIFPLLILSFVPRIIRTYNLGEYPNLFFSLADGSLLILFYSLAIYNKKKTAKHMRYMIASALALLGPTVGRIGPIMLGWGDVLTQNVQYGIIYSILISLVLYDKKNQKKYQPYLVAIGAYVIHQIIYHIIFL
mgnify:FL=1